jgi:thiol-disulfide isomerase/thioredoxin
MERRVFLRTACSLFAAGLWTSGTRAGEVPTSSDPVFHDTYLRGNALASLFRKPKAPVVLPPVRLLGREGAHSLSELKGKTRIVSLWSEWCAPCLAEAGDLAPLQHQFGGATFEILAVLTKSAKRLDYTGARSVLDQVKAGSLPLWIEPDGGDAVYQSATAQLGPGIPLLLLLDSKGRVFGYSHGAPSEIDPAKLGIQLKPGGVLSSKDKAVLAAATEKSGTLWRSPDARVFVKALAEHPFS